MGSWSIFTAAFAAVVIQAWVCRKGSPTWYLSCIVPLLYGAAVAWMFVDQDCLLALQVILFGAAIPITLLLTAWRRRRENHGEPPSQP